MIYVFMWGEQNISFQLANILQMQVNRKTQKSADDKDLD